MMININAALLRQIADSSLILNRRCTYYAFSIKEKFFTLIKQKLIEANVKIFKETTEEGTSICFVDPYSHKIELHIRDCQTLIDAKKISPGSWKELEFYV